MPYIVEFEMFIWFSLWARFGYRFKVYFCLGLGNFFDGLILGLRRAASPRALRPGSSSVRPCLSVSSPPRCSQGILGIDGPTHPDSILYKERYEHFATEAWDRLKSWAMYGNI